MRSRTLTKHNREKILKKANDLVNQSETKARVLQRCGISYRQLLALSRDPAWQPALIFSQPHKASRVWISHAYTQLLREFCFRQHLQGDMTIKHLSWLFDRSERSIYRFIEKEKHTKK